MPIAYTLVQTATVVTFVTVITAFPSAPSARKNDVKYCFHMDIVNINNIKSIIRMKRTKKKYEVPTLDVVELKTERILCGSNDPQYNNPFSGGGEDW